MDTLASVDRMLSSELEGKCVKVNLRRESESDVIFLSCDTIPELFVAVTDEDQIRAAIDRALKNTFSQDGRRVQVYTNGKIDGPIIDTMVHLTAAK